MNLSQHASSTGLAAINTLFNSGTLTFYSGQIPPAPENPVATGNAALAMLTFAAAAFGIPAFGGTLQETAAAAFAASSVTPTAAGTATFARAVASSYATVLADYTVGMAWAPSTPVVVGQYMVNNGNTYMCMTAGTTSDATGAGGPSGNGTAITDGTAVWTWNNVGSTDIVLTNTVLSTAGPLALNTLTHAQGAV